MAYIVKEIYPTLQGEGANTGRAAVLCRFAGCNLWSGREKDRATATCTFCDTQFLGTDGPNGGRFATAAELADTVASVWGEGSDERFVVCTGGEPLLQLDADLISRLHEHGFRIAIETNGTILAPAGVDWVCVSPKAGAPMRLRSGDELKIVYPQQGLDPCDYEHLSFEHFFLQPMDCGPSEDHVPATVDYCRRHPRWRISLQTHKLLGIP
jgi:7-carboxy-7-deazaguanine synthase (Cx14CxxC type)